MLRLVWGSLVRHCEQTNQRSSLRSSKIYSGDAWDFPIYLACFKIVGVEFVGRNYSTYAFVTFLKLCDANADFLEPNTPVICDLNPYSTSRNASTITIKITPSSSATTQSPGCVRLLAMSIWHSSSSYSNSNSSSSSSHRHDSRTLTVSDDRSSRFGVSLLALTTSFPPAARVS
jgi:hypothetical protein